MSIKWIKTDKHVYGAIYREHGQNLQVFGAFTDMEGMYGTPCIMTEWGFKDAGEPIIKNERNPKDENDVKFYIASYMSEE